MEGQSSKILSNVRVVSGGERWSVTWPGGGITGRVPQMRDPLKQKAWGCTGALCRTNWRRWASATTR